MTTTPVMRYIIAGTLLFTFLFYRSFPAINVLLFELYIVAALFILARYKLHSLLSVTALSGLVISASSFVVFHSDWALFVNFLAFIIFIGVAIEPKVRSLLTSIQLGIENMLFAPMKLLEIIKQRPWKEKSIFKKTFRYLYLIVPLLILGLFVILYRSSNPLFDEFMGRFTGIFADTISRWVGYIDGVLVVIFFLGLIFSNYSFVHSRNESLIQKDASAVDHLLRKRKAPAGRLVAFKNEARAGIFLLTMLNALLLLVNTIDVYWVWFNFEWDGNYLKQFVHEGTYLLILSIFISMAIVLYFFRGSQNFYSKNHTLKWLCYVWLFQNFILTISVAVRNLHYIEYFSLAYKRIGVLFFLALVIIGIVTVLLKVRDRKSNFFLFRINTLACYSVLIVSTALPWDGIIANYNFAHAEKSYLHFDFMLQLSPFTFETLDKDINHLLELEKHQRALFPLEPEYLDARSFHAELHTRMQNFALAQDTATWQEWNWADQQAMNYIERAHPEYLREANEN